MTKALGEEGQAKLAAFRKKQVSHLRQTQVQEAVWQSLDAAVDDHAVTIVVGPSGVGKTNLLELVEVETISRLKSSADRDGRLPFVYVSAVPPQHDTFRFVSLYSSILSATDEITQPRKAFVPAPGVKRAASDVIHRAAINVLRHRRPIVFCIDEAQHMTYAVRAERLRIHFDNVKALADAIDSPILLAGTHEVLDMGLSSGQLGRRVRHIPFLPYRGTDAEMSTHFGAVRYFVSVLPLRLTFDPAKHAPYFFERSVGSVGVLKPWFERVLRQVLSDGRSSASMEDFERAAMPLGKLTKLASEYQDALIRLRAFEGNVEELRAALGFARAPSNPARANTRRVGERTLGRDPVGSPA